MAQLLLYKSQSKIFINVNKFEIYFQFFTDYGSEAVNSRGNMPNAPFGKLLFLVRDWQFADETGYGYVGGRKLIEDILKVRKKLLMHKHLSICSLDVYCMDRIFVSIFMYKY
mgnify:CR=1 FL=1